MNSESAFTTSLVNAPAIPDYAFLPNLVTGEQEPRLTVSLYFILTTELQLICQLTLGNETKIELIIGF